MSGMDSGTRLGAYEIQGLLGRGGMGEVYRATDSKLGRDVAIKILTPEFAHHPERLARFEREARVLASLNHPNIAAIYGFENVDGVPFLVLEYVPGQTLAELIANEPGARLTWSQICDQVSRALEAAHEKGIIHRDLKPANIKITPDERVKVLDFGLAKAFAGEPAAEDPAQSPTLSLAATRAGTLLGTAVYMSPEQARGRKLDKRTDIWSFGCVLYEMLTGKRAFSGESVTDVLAAVVGKEPDWAALPADAPVALIRRCLEKDPAQRLRDIGDARLLLDVELTAKTPRRQEGPGFSWRLGALAVILAVATALATLWLRPRTPREERVMHAAIPAPPEVTFHLSSASPGPAAVSPDGTRVVFTGRTKDGRRQLWLRALDTVAARPLPGTDGAQYPFWAPDSRSIGFFADGKLKRIPASGGPALVLAAAADGKGGSWGPSGVILYARDAQTPLYRVPENGGEPAAVTDLSKTEGINSHRLPHFLPDGRHFLFLGRVVGGIREGYSNAVMLGSLDGTQPSLLLRADSHATYASGYLLFVWQRNLMAQPFDLQALRLTGDAQPLAEGVGRLSGAMAGLFTASQDGILMHQAGIVGETQWRIAWFDREGRQVGALGEAAAETDVELSPDGRRAALSIGDHVTGTTDMWIYDVGRGTRARFTFDPSSEQYPVWSPDGRVMVFASNRSGRFQLYRKAMTGSETEELLLESKMDTIPTGWSPDGRYVTFLQLADRKDVGPWLLDVSASTGSRQPVSFLPEPEAGWHARFSGDGRWLAYDTQVSGMSASQVYVRPFPGPGRQWQVTQDGGVHPRWRKDGKEIFYQATDGRLMAAPITLQADSVEVGQARPIGSLRLPVQSDPSYDVAPDGQRLLVRVPLQEEAGGALTLVTNWTATLRRN